MSLCLFVSDLHGRPRSYEKLFEAIGLESPAAVFLGGDLFPNGVSAQVDQFLEDTLISGFASLRDRLAGRYPRVFLILGNDDLRAWEREINEAAGAGLWEHIHGRRSTLGATPVYGYAYVPPTPFMLKDWERYDVSQFVDPGCVSPEEGRRSVEVDPREIRHATIQQDLEKLAEGDDVSGAIFLFHTPPYQTKLDRAALDGRMVDHVPLDVNIGSIAVRRFVESRGPRLTLHGHVHESARLTGSWRDMIGPTHMFSAAHDGPELALVRFDPDDLESASRELI